MGRGLRVVETGWVWGLWDGITVSFEEYMIGDERLTVDREACLV